MNDVSHKWNIGFKPLVLGFALSAILLYGAYFLVTTSMVKGVALLAGVLGLGIIQALIQLVLFLHVGVEEKPQWNLMTFLFMVLIVVILIGGSLWIMYNLNYNMMLLM